MKSVVLVFFALALLLGLSAGISEAATAGVQRQKIRWWYCKTCPSCCTIYGEEKFRCDPRRCLFFDGKCVC
ncbi:hypothetical protein QR680_005557 [Steinernema hermaphroditum]|uniref:Uncharacterized protein n=1 Tax=Steinernema hermaphroditum TaxID=289476 RepID=A0AA39LVL6_9BILA|nr:hypothetical protein QR680_005557 [Steinernema hermaphroditum]